MGATATTVLCESRVNALETKGKTDVAAEEKLYEKKNKEKEPDGSFRTEKK